MFLDHTNSYWVVRPFSFFSFRALGRYLRCLYSDAALGPPHTWCPMDLSIRGTFIVPNRFLSRRSQITCEPIFGGEAVFLKVVTNHNFKDSKSTLKFFYCRLPLFSVQLHVVVGGGSGVLGGVCCFWCCWWWWGWWSCCWWWWRQWWWSCLLLFVVLLLLLLLLEEWIWKRNQVD